MANKYVYSGAVGTESGDDWTNAYTTLQQGLTAAGAGDTIYIDSDHQEQTDALTTLSATNGTQTSPVVIISTNSADDSYQSMASATGYFDVGPTGANDLYFDFSQTYIGVTFISPDNIALTSNTACTQTFIDCYIKVGGEFAMNNSSGREAVVFENTDLEWTLPGNIAVNGGSFIWRGGSVSFSGTGAITTQLCKIQAEAATAYFSDVDLSALDSGDYLIYQTIPYGNQVYFYRCKFPATLAGISNTAIQSSTTWVKMHSCSSADVIYAFEETYSEGTASESTSVYLDATYDGTNGYSVSLVTSTVAVEWYRPLRFKLADLYVSATGKTLTVEVLTNNVTLQNDEFWIEVEYPDSTTAALGNILSTRAATVLTTPANLTTSAKGASDWTGETGTPVYQKVVADFTGVADEAVGVYTVWACLAKPSTTVYVDPKVVVS